MLVGAKSAVTGYSPCAVNVWVAVATPSITVAGYSVPSTVNVTVPAALAGLTRAVRVAASSTRGLAEISTVVFVEICSETVTVAVSSLVVNRSGLAGMNVAVTVASPAVSRVNSAVAVPSARVTVSVWPPTVNSTCPSAVAGVTLAVATMVSPAMTCVASRVRSVWVASDSTCAVPVAVLVA